MSIEFTALAVTIYTYIHTQAYLKTYKGIAVKHSPWVQWNILSKCLNFSTGEGWALRHVGTWAHVLSSAFIRSPRIISNLRVCDLWRAFYSEGDGSSSHLTFRKAQKSTLRTTICRVTRWFALVNINFHPGWNPSQ